MVRFAGVLFHGRWNESQRYTRHDWRCVWGKQRRQLGHRIVGRTEHDSRDNFDKFGNLDDVDDRPHLNDRDAKHDIRA